MALLLTLGSGAAVTALIQPALAIDLASAKATVDAAKAAGVVGEQGDGYLGFVHGSADAVTTAAVTAINDGRKKAYEAAAAKTGVSAEAAGEATARQLIAAMPAGQYYKPIDGSWTKK
ncbi:MAG: YdbL family protein [Alphaproteobacteria bacterium]|nr:YdbL family protein [Alphaproteobacteria bacterium]